MSEYLIIKHNYNRAFFMISPILYNVIGLLPACAML